MQDEENKDRMTDHRVICVLLGMGLIWGCATDYAPNDSASRGLNEMKASKAPIPPKPDPRDIRIAELERATADRDLDINRLRDSSSQLSSLSGDLEQSKCRASDLEIHSFGEGSGVVCVTKPCDRTGPTGKPTGR